MYGYDKLLDDLKFYESLGAEVFYIGSTHLGNLIPAVLIGDPCFSAVICVYGTHAREHITCALSRVHILRHLKLLPQNFSLYFVPMLNPDGVELCLKGLNSALDYVQKEFLFKINGYSDDFSLWKANIRGVDLNTNFPAKWGTGKKNKTYPGPSDFIGYQPLSEKESCGLYRLTEKIKPAAVLSFHCKGEEIYWRFYQERCRLKRDKKIALRLSKRTGYKLVDGFNSSGGYKDYCVESLKIPAFTIEVGDDKFSHPFPYSELDSIIEKNFDIVDALMETLYIIRKNYNG